MGFVRRERGTLCPICEKESWCTVSDQGDVVRCMRVESDKESLGEDGTCGWLHRIKERIPVEKNARERQPPLEQSEVLEMAQRYYKHEKAADTRERLAASLGVSVRSLELMRVGFGCDTSGRTWSSWPSRDGEGNVIGITRRYESGEKKTLYRTRAGLFYPAEAKDVRGPILIVEGPTDVAAALSVGLPAIGRPSNTGGAGWIQKLIGMKHAVVIGENDLDESRRGKLQSCPVDCEGCGHCWPGKFGAVMVAKHLNRPWVLPPAGVKDFRELVAKGCWWEILRAMG